jgi:protein-disulfide isomerase
MFSFLAKNKVFIFVILGTCVLLFGGIFLFTKGDNSASTAKPISSSLLVPQGVTTTSGFVNGSYLPASSSAKVTLVEFGDYECPACGVYSPFVKNLLTDFSGQINYAFRNYPLSQHKNALISSYAVEAAGLQGKYWEMHEKVYSTQSIWSNMSDPTSTFMGYAKDLGLITDKFTSDLSSATVKTRVQNDTNDGNAVGITETPTFYINGIKVVIDGTSDQLKNLVQAELKK